MLAAPLSLAAQGAHITFDVLEHDFGEIAELGGPATFKFIYVNSGVKPLVINTVETSCGCTSPSWSKKPLMPGQKGFVEVDFDPRERFGSFLKRITVKSNATEGDVYLYISGTVSDRLTSVSSEFPYVMFDLRLKTPTVRIGSVKVGRKSVTDIEVINPSRADLLIEPDADSLPPYIKIEALPSVLAPGEKGIIRTIFDSQGFGSLGFVKMEAPILINTYRYHLMIRGFVVEQ